MSAEIYKEHMGSYGADLLCEDRKTRVTSYWHHGKMHLDFLYCGVIYKSMTYDYGDGSVLELLKKTVRNKLN
jgi:hypothetical protein|tara:strand:- start:1613 stop:1828 length:216 start_codon:yes stop_codon:yes gene_type:complete